MLEQNQEVVVKKDESLGALINLKIFVGKTDEAIALLQSRTFSIAEGGSAFSSGQAWVNAHLVRGLEHYGKKQYREALADFETAVNLPDNLRSEQRSFRQEEINYWTGCALSALGEKDKARQAWEKVVNPRNESRGEDGGGQPLVMIHVTQGEQHYYQALAKQKLGNKEGNEAIFNELITSGAALNQPVSTGANTSQSFRRQSSSRTNISLAHYIAGLGYTGLGNKTKAREEFNAALASSPDYLDAKIALSQF